MAVKDLVQTGFAKAAPVLHQRRSRACPPGYEMAFIYGTIPFEVPLPVQDLRRIAGHTARRIHAHPNRPVWIWSIGGFAVGWAVLALLFLPWLGNYIAALIFGFLPGGGLGLLAGAFIGRKRRPRPYWFIRAPYDPELGYRTIQLMPESLALAYERYVDDHESAIQQAMTALKLTAIDADVLDAAGIPDPPDAYEMYDQANMEDERQFHRSGLSGTKKLQIGLLITLNIAMAAILGLTAISLSGG